MKPPSLVTSCLVKNLPGPLPPEYLAVSHLVPEIPPSSRSGGSVQGASQGAAAQIPTRVLLVDGDAAARQGLIGLLTWWGFAAEAAGDGEQGLTMVGSFHPSIVLAALVLPRLNGLELLRALKDQLTELTFIIITDADSIERAIAATREGAYDYLIQPVDPGRLRVLLAHIVERQDMLRVLAALRREAGGQRGYDRIVGRSASLERVRRFVEQAATSDKAALLYGESGVGKRHVARTIHELSPRSAHPFVPINCATMPGTVLERHLLGHEPDASAEAGDRQQGCVELAHRGTLFLDEITKTSPQIQTTLLRVLEDRQVCRLGDQNVIPVDVRVIAATSRQSREAVSESELRRDLYDRVSDLAVQIPPLRERPEDIPFLVEAFIEQFNDRHHKNVKGISEIAMRMLGRYDWPGNVGELKTVIERAVMLTDGDLIEAEHLSADLLDAKWSILAPGTSIAEAERRLIDLTLQHTLNKSQAARMLGISVKTLHNKLNRYKLEGRPIRDSTG